MQYFNVVTKIKKTLTNYIRFLLIIIFVMIVFVIYHGGNNRYGIESMENGKDKLKEYVSKKLEKKEEHIFPFRYFKDENSTILPIVAVTGFFRGDDAKKLYQEYLDNGIFVFGITAYKSFPKKILHESEDAFHLKDDFDYVKNIPYWLCCFRSPENYGFTDENIIEDISESDLYDIDTEPEKKKKYDFIYICNKDGDNCPKDGWNSINRNFKLAKECFPILLNDYKLKGLIVGRVGCGLEEEYGDKIEVTDFLDWYVLQDKMRESTFLFLPNVQDASPRVIAECLVKGVPVLMNKKILCGSKYVTNETGEFFTDKNNLRPALDSLLNRINTIDTKKWWMNNYGVKNTSVKIRNFLYPACPDVLENVKEVTFLL